MTKIAKSRCDLEPVMNMSIIYMAS